MQCAFAVDLGELQQALHHLGIPFAEVDAAVLFDDIDSDASGRIDSTELYVALRAYGAPRKELAGSQPRLGMPQRLEPNPLGTYDERKAVHALKRRLHANRLRVRDLFAQWDVDGDGRITMRELERALGGLCIPIDRPAVRRLFQQIGARRTEAARTHRVVL